MRSPCSPSTTIRPGSPWMLSPAPRVTATISSPPETSHGHARIRAPRRGIRPSMNRSVGTRRSARAKAAPLVAGKGAMKELDTASIGVAFARPAWRRPESAACWEPPSRSGPWSWPSSASGARRFRAAAPPGAPGRGRLRCARLGGDRVRHHHQRARGGGRGRRGDRGAGCRGGLGQRAAAQGQPGRRVAVRRADASGLGSPCGKSDRAAMGAGRTPAGGKPTLAGGCPPVAPARGSG
jgi:hypothetical protein